MAWGALSFAATQEIAQAALEASPAVSVGDCTTQTPGPVGIAALLSVVFLEFF